MSNRRLALLRVMAILLITGCVALIFVGAAVDNFVLSLAGILLLFNGGFITAVVMSIVLIIRAVREVKQEDVLRERGELDPVAAEEQSIKRINRSHGYANQRAHGEHMLKHTIRAYQLADKSEKIKSVLLLVWLLGLIIAGIVFVFIGETYWQIRIVGFCCWGGFVGTIIIAGIAVNLTQRRSRKPRADSALQRAKVVGCVLSSSTSMGGERTQHLTSITYRVKLQLPDGTRKTAYCREYYAVGTELMVRESQGRNLVTVVE